MSAEYPGLPTVARKYWRDYLISAGAWALVTAFTGAAGALIVLVLLPEALWLYVVAAVSLGLHYAALFVTDVWRGEHEPNQTTFSSPVMLLALVIVVGVMMSAVLLFATWLGYVAETFLGAPAILAFGLAAYYPVADVLVMRRGFYTLGAVAILATVVVIDTVINLRQATLETLPVVGKRRRPQS